MEKSMGRDTSKPKKKVPTPVASSDKKPGEAQPSGGSKKTTGGWKDVFDSSTYSSGPGDNVYVFG